MAGEPNTIDYSSLNTSLKPKNWNMGEIKKNTVETIGKLFLVSNRLEVSDSMNKKKIDRRNEKLNQFANNIEKASDWMKSNFIITINYLLDNKLLKTETIKSLHLTELEKNLDSETSGSNVEDKKLQKILDELTNNMPESAKLALDKHVNMELLNLNRESQNAEELWKKVKELEQENADLKTDLDAMNSGFEMMERDSRSRWSFRNTERVANAIHKLNENKGWLSQEKITRMVLWQADKFVPWWDVKSRRVFKRFNRMDVNKQYNKVSDKMDEKLKSAKGKEFLAIRRIQIEVNKAHDNYINEIKSDTKRSNIRNINSAMAKAA